MSDVILKVENVSKLYKLGTVGTGTFGGDIQRFWKTKVLGQDDPFLKIGQTNDRTSKEKADFVWALKDINFEVKRGEVLGIIGKNGAGKSTLLKLLSRITSPTTGSIKSAGRMASLLEVGTGFHPELTGRENIFLNGAILGMTKKEIQSKFDEIVDFSGCELYIDTPTKRYSSGMTVRLGFAVAAFLDPEILVVDEVLAVGDAEFQKKAIGKMKEVSFGGDRTVLFVSHNMENIEKLCSRCILLNNGTISLNSHPSEVIDGYLTVNQNTIVNKKYIRPIESQELMSFKTIEIISVDKSMNVRIAFEILNFSSNPLQKVRIGGSLRHLSTETVVGTFFTDEEVTIEKKITRVELEWNLFNVIPEKYLLSFSLGTGNEFTGLRDYDVVINQIGIDLSEFNKSLNFWDSRNWGVIRFNPKIIL